MARNVTRILVPTDFSVQSEGALAFATTLAGKFRASVHLLHVLEDPYSTSAYATEVYGYLPAGLKETWQKNAEERLAKLTEQAKFKGTSSVVFGSPAKAVVEYADANGVDLIVMGTHGRSGMAHLLLGSVAERVVRTAPCPVLTVRETAEPVEATATIGGRAAVPVGS